MSNDQTTQFIETQKEVLGEIGKTTDFDLFEFLKLTPSAEEQE